MERPRESSEVRLHSLTIAFITTLGISYILTDKHLFFIYYAGGA